MIHRLTPFVLVGAGLFALALGPAFAQDPAAAGDPAAPLAVPAPPAAAPGNAKVDEKVVDAAIARGAEWLKHKARYSEGEASSELVLFTLIHAGVFLNDPAVDEGIKFVSTVDLAHLKYRQKNYRIALAAMALEAANRTRWQERIADYARFLVANQCKNGQWSYGEIPPQTVTSKAPGGDGRQVSSGGGAPGAGGHAGEKTAVIKEIPVDAPRIGPEHGDNSNTQFALLGLRACSDAGCRIPAKTWQDAKHIMEQAQKPDGGWGYHAPHPGKKGGAPADDPSYGSMSCSGLCDLVICDWNLGDRGFQKDTRIAHAAAWIEKNFSITENPLFPAGGPAQRAGSGKWHYYFLYALERAGMLFGTETFGPHDWYAEGAEYLLKEQKPDGSWDGGDNEVSDTCFAILFLRRATKPIVPSIHSK